MRTHPPTSEIRPIIQREFRGVNRLDPFSIRDEYATSMKNLTSDDYPAFSTRSGYSLFGSAFANPILGLSSWKNNELHAVSNGAWYRYSGGSWGSALASGLSTSAVWSFANFKGSLSDINLIGANGVDAIRRYDGSTVTTLTGAPSGGNYIITFSNRLFCSVTNTIHASELNVPTNWTTTIDSDADPYQINVATTDGEQINGLIAGIGYVTIFKPSSIHELWGADPSTVRIETVSYEVGAINNQSAVTLNGTIYLIHRTGIYKYSGGNKPSRNFSDPVQKFIGEMNTSARDKCAVGTDGERVYFSIPVDSSSTPDTVLVYNPRFDAWTVWKDMTVLHFAQAGSSWYTGNNDGRVLQMGGSNDAGTAINWEWVSKPFGSATLNKQIRWYTLWILAEVPTGSSLSAYVSPSASGDSDWVLIDSITPTTGIQSARMIITPDKLAQRNYIRLKLSGSGPVTVYEVDRDQRDEQLI